MKNTNIHVLNALETFLNILKKNKNEIQNTQKEHLHIPFVFEVDSGLCVNLSHFINVDRAVTKDFIHPSVESAQVFDVMYDHFRRWEHFSGSTSYPIKVPAYLEAERSNPLRVYQQLPKWIGEYGDLRWQLVDHILACIQEEYEVISNG